MLQPELTYPLQIGPSPHLTRHPNRRAGWGHPTLVGVVHETSESLFLDGRAQLRQLLYLGRVHTSAGKVEALHLRATFKPLAILDRIHTSAGEVEVLHPRATFKPLAIPSPSLCATALLGVLDHVERLAAYQIPKAIV